MNDSGISEEDFIQQEHLATQESCISESKPETTSVFEIVRSFARAANRMVVSDIQNLDKILIDGFLDYLVT